MPYRNRKSLYTGFRTLSYHLIVYLQNAFVANGALSALVSILCGHYISAQMNAAIAIDCITNGNEHAQHTAQMEGASDALCKLFQVGVVKIFVPVNSFHESQHLHRNESHKFITFHHRHHDSLRTL